MARVLTTLAMVAAIWSVPALAADKCQKIADVVFEEVASRAVVLDNLKKDPKEGPLGEPWRYLAFMFTDEMDKLKVPIEKQHEIARSVAGLTFSDNPEIETDIFTEYYYLTCKRETQGESSTPLASIDPKSLLSCWDSASSRADFQGCVGKLLIPAQ